MLPIRKIAHASLQPFKSIRNISLGFFNHPPQMQKYADWEGTALTMWLQVSLAVSEILIYLSHRLAVERVKGSMSRRLPLIPLFIYSSTTLAGSRSSLLL
jgi:hypothetical protein